MNPIIVVKNIHLSILNVFEKKFFDAMERVDPKMKDKIFYSIENYSPVLEPKEEDEDWAFNYKFEEVTPHSDFCSVMIFSKIRLSRIENKIYNALTLFIDDSHISREMF